MNNLYCKHKKMHFLQKIPCKKTFTGISGHVFGLHLHVACEFSLYIFFDLSPPSFKSAENAGNKGSKTVSF